ncbi:DEAD/DEAH box helicase [Streptomyces sp. NPDC015032]|uniref:DEAD/DEAH box helicase n=1 Tax=Streptomyces sp. NPDC015032 TaxID=3364937 RepID=UPI003701E218
MQPHPTTTETPLSSGRGSELTAHCAAFLPGDPPRNGLLAFIPDGAAQLPAVGTPARLPVVTPQGSGVGVRTVDAVVLPVAEALPHLLTADAASASGSVAFWGAAARFALGLTVRGLLIPEVSQGGFDAWRAGPIAEEDTTWLRRLAAAMPAEAHAVPLPATSPVQLARQEPLLRGFVDAVADAMPRTRAAPLATGSRAFADTMPQRIPELRYWADEIAADLEAGLRVSLRVELPSGAHGGPDQDTSAFRAVVQLHSARNPSLVTDLTQAWNDAVALFGPRAREAVRTLLCRGARAWPPLDRLTGQPVPGELALNDDELYSLLHDSAEALTATGIDVHYPKDLIRDLTSAALIEPAHNPRGHVPSRFTPELLLRFRWHLAMNGDPLSQDEMDALAEAHRPVVRLRDQWVLVDRELIRRSQEPESMPLGAIDGLSALLTGTTEIDSQTIAVEPGGWLATILRRIKNNGQHALPDPPAELRATLRGYQLQGLAWMDRLTSSGLGCCLADDMGLGKTITLIALHLRRQEDSATAGPTLVVCPASLLGNWEKEIRRFAPGVRTRRYHGTRRTLDGLETGEFVLTTYATMRQDISALATTTWGLVVADEAQHIKNPAAATARAMRTVSSGVRVALTGTPVENNLSELWSILDWTIPGLLGSLSDFRRTFAIPIERGDDPAVAERLACLVRPFLLRRRKSDADIVPELPPKTETDHAVHLTREQAALYEAVVRESLDAISGTSGRGRRSLVLKLLTALKQICNHPAQYLKESSPKLPGRSGKFALLDELVDTIVAEGGAILVFTQYVTMARMILRHLETRGTTAQLLHGNTPIERREEMVARFQRGEVRVFVLSLKAAGTGLNLTRAGHVIHFDRWWNPAVEAQATDRAHRIGQTLPVQVHRLITEGTVEERVAQLLAAKGALADAVLGSGDTALTELSDTELSRLVALRRS